MKGYRPSHISKDLWVSPSSIARLRDKVGKLRKDRSLKNAPGQGRKDKASLRDVKTWSKVMFSDKSTFRLIRGTKKIVRRRFVQRVRGGNLENKDYNFLKYLIFFAFIWAVTVETVLTLLDTSHITSWIMNYTTLSVPFDLL